MGAQSSQLIQPDILSSYRLPVHAMLCMSHATYHTEICRLFGQGGLQCFEFLMIFSQISFKSWHNMFCFDLIEQWEIVSLHKRIGVAIAVGNRRGASVNGNQAGS